MAHPRGGEQLAREHLPTGGRARRGEWRMSDDLDGPDGPRDYDREFSTPIDYRVRRRIGYSHDHGDVTRFAVQLEYRLESDWMEVVRFDHDPASEHGHDATVEGVHMDVYRGGVKIRTEEVFPPMPASEALSFAEEHLAEHAERYIRRFEEWHGIRNR